MIGDSETDPGSRGPRLGGEPDHRVHSVYVHAPFCARRCIYCDFAVDVRARPGHGAWVSALSAELTALEAEGSFSLGSPLKTLYVGGGTPSLLGADAMAGLADVIGRSRLGSDDLEWTAEANPESLTPEVAVAWREAGVTRLSVGVQSFDDGALKWMGRLHGPEGAHRAVAAARSAGFHNLSIDLIFGLPGHLDRSWSRDLRCAIDLGVPHVSLYGLTVESGTPLARAVSEGRVEVAGEGRYRAEYLEAAATLVAAGYRHYEVSNFALPSFESKHNRVYWSGEDYLGLGNSSHSYVHPVRRWNLRSWAEYEAATQAGRLPVASSERLTGPEQRLERIWLDLRTDEGFELSTDAARLNALVTQWTASGVARAADERLLLTPEGWLVMDRLTIELEAALTPAGGDDAEVMRPPGGLPGASSGESARSPALDALSGLSRS